MSPLRPPGRHREARTASLTVLCSVRQGESTGALAVWATAASELITECDLRRDIVYRHTDLVQDFQARAKARDSTPTAMQELADENRQFKAGAEDLRDERLLVRRIREGRGRRGRQPYGFWPMAEAFRWGNHSGGRRGHGHRPVRWWAGERAAAGAKSPSRISSSRTRTRGVPIWARSARSSSTGAFTGRAPGRTA